MANYIETFDELKDGEIYICETYDGEILFLKFLKNLIQNVGRQSVFELVYDMSKIYQAGDLISLDEVRYVFMLKDEIKFATVDKEYAKIKLEK